MNESYKMLFERLLKLRSAQKEIRSSVLQMEKRFDSLEEEKMKLLYAMADLSEKENQSHELKNKLT